MFFFGSCWPVLVRQKRYVLVIGQYWLECLRNLNLIMNCAFFVYSCGYDEHKIILIWNLGYVEVVSSDIDDCHQNVKYEVYVCWQFSYLKDTLSHPCQPMLWTCSRTCLWQLPLCQLNITTTNQKNSYKIYSSQQLSKIVSISISNTSNTFLSITFLTSIISMIFSVSDIRYYPLFYHEPGVCRATRWLECK